MKPSLNLKKVKEYDEKLLYTIFDTIAYFKEKRLTQEEILNYYHNGINLTIHGNIRNDLDEVNYAIFMSKVTNNRIILNCKSAKASTGHEDLMESKGKEILLYAGIAKKGHFASDSSNWTKIVSNQQTELGHLINSIVCKYFHIK